MEAKPAGVHEDEREEEGWPEAEVAERGESVWRTLISGGLTPSERLTLGVARPPGGGPPPPPPPPPGRGHPSRPPPRAGGGLLRARGNGPGHARRRDAPGATRRRRLHPRERGPRR